MLQTPKLHAQCMSAPALAQVEHVLRQSHPAADMPAADAVLVYQIQTMEIRYVDTQGNRHALGIGDVLGAVLDPLGES